MTDSPASPADDARPRRRRRFVWPVLVVAVLAAAGGLVAAGLAAPATDRAQSSAATPESYGKAPTYRLVDQNGRSVSSGAFAGKVQVVSFLFPYCTSYCPLLARDMARLAGTVAAGPLHGKVQLVSFNVDPEGAGPAVLRKFITQYGGHPTDPDWEYLTGTPAQIRQVVTGGFHVFFTKSSLAAEHSQIARQKAAGTYTAQPKQPNPLAKRAHVDYDVAHNDYVAIINANGDIVAIFGQASTLTPAQLLAAVRDANAGRPIPPQPVR